MCSMCSVVGMCRLDLGCCLDCPGVGVAATKTSHECWLGGSGLDDSVAAGGMHGV